MIFLWNRGNNLLTFLANTTDETKNQASIYYHATSVQQAECRTCQIVHSDCVQDTQRDRTMLQEGLFIEMRTKLDLTFEVSPSFITKPSPGTEGNLLNYYHQLKDVKTQRRTRYFTASCSDTNTKKKNQTKKSRQQKPQLKQLSWGFLTYILKTYTAEELFLPTCLHEKNSQHKPQWHTRLQSVLPTD